MNSFRLKVCTVRQAWKWMISKEIHFFIFNGIKLVKMHSDGTVVAAFYLS